jgi:hypothetical protein
MKFAAIALTALGLAVAVAGSAAAARFTDVDYLRASRCKGIAAGLGADTTSLDALLKAERGSRIDTILRHGEEEANRAKRQAADANMKERLSAELASGCAVYTSAGGAGGKAVASQ